MGGQQLDRADGRTGDDRFDWNGFVQQDIVDRTVHGPDVGAGGHGQTGLRIEIDHEHAPPAFGKRRGDIEGAGGLGGATFLIEEGDEAGHREDSTRTAGRPSVRTRLLLQGTTRGGRGQAHRSRPKQPGPAGGRLS